MDRLVCVKDFETAALKLLDNQSSQFYSSAADDGITLKENQRAFKRLRLRPRMLRDVSQRSTSTLVLGKPVSFPLGISPTAMQKLAHADGECATAKAAESMGTIYIMSTMSTSTIEQVAAAAPKGRKWFQQYLYKDRNIHLQQLKRVEECGFEAVVATVDAPLVGRRRVNVRDGFTLPPHLDLVNFKSQRSALAFHDTLVSQSATWDDIKWLTSVTKLPVIVKGILTPEDAELAVQSGVSGVFVSNHGARQLDTVPATIEVLPSIVKQVNGRCEIYLDGGVSTGADVFKGIALGATMVFVGRPLIWGLAVGGETGARKVLQIFRDEFDLTMALTGAASVVKITPEYIGRRLESHL